MLQKQKENVYAFNEIKSKEKRKLFKKIYLNKNCDFFSIFMLLRPISKMKEKKIVEQKNKKREIS